MNGIKKDKKGYLNNEKQNNVINGNIVMDKAKMDIRLFGENMRIAIKKYKGLIQNNICLK